MCRKLSRMLFLLSFVGFPAAGIAQTNLGAVNLGSSYTSTATVTFSAAGTLSKIGIVTQGATGLDFTSSGTGTCKVGTTYSKGQSCTVGVTFTPAFSGDRHGAIVLHSSTSLLATEFLRGFGTGPQITFNPSSATVIDPPVIGNGTTGLIDPLSLAIDGAGNLYITSGGIKGVVLVPANGGLSSIFDPSVDGSPVPYISNIAIDGAGNIFLEEQGKPLIYEVRPDGSTAEFSTTTPQSNWGSITVDGAGNLYIVDLGLDSTSVIEYPGGDSQATPITISITVNGNRVIYPGSLAVDASGDLFLVDAANGVFNYVLELSAAQVAGGGGDASIIAPVVNGLALNLPYGIAVDGTGNLFIADYNNARIVVAPTNNGQPYAIQPMVDSLALAPAGLALDGARNLFIADAGNNRVLRIQRSQPPSLNFGPSPIAGTGAPNSKTVQVQNSGASILSITGLTYPPDFPEQTSGTNPCSTATSLSSGEQCNLNIEFLPASTGTFQENVTLTDNTLNVNGTTQKIQTSGIGEEGSIQLSATSLAYGFQAIDTDSPSQQVTLTNNTTSPLSIVGIQVTGPGASAFIFGSSCPASLPSRSSCSIHGHFTPPNNVLYQAEVTITYRGAGSQTIYLSGQGAFPPIGYLEETALSFGTQQVGTESASQYVKLVSDGGLPLQIDGFHITGPNASSFIFGSDCPASLQPPNYCHIHGHFAPTTTGTLTATLTLTLSGHVVVPPVTLTGTGTSQPTTISLSPTALDFGVVNVGSTSASQRIALTNKSVSVLDIGSITVTGPNASSFVFANDCQPMVPAGKNCSIHGHFTPTAKGPLTAILTVTDSGVGSPQTVTLKGTGQ